MTTDPPTYSSADINKLEMPSIEEFDGGWRSVWRLAVQESLGADGLSRVAAATSARCGTAVELRLDGELVSLILVSDSHPLAVEGFTTVDCVLGALDMELQIRTVNGAPRHQWRTFRQASA